MSIYTDNYDLRYQTPSVQNQIEVAVIKAANDIFNENVGAPDHENRLKWAKWVNSNSPTAAIPFQWPVAMNPSIQASYATNPTGGSVQDSDIQFVVNTNLDAVIADWVLNNVAT